MNGMEKLREYADATKWGGECRILHEYHKDFGGECSDRECGECRAVYLRAVADEIERDRADSPKVLDADGVEIKQGDTVYVLGFGEPLTVKGFADDGRVLMSFHDEDSLGYKPSRLTHEQPDSWQRIEDDCAKFCIEYCDEHGLLDPGCNAAEGDASTRHCMDCGDSCEERMARDLVRRAKALAERS